MGNNRQENMRKDEGFEGENSFPLVTSEAWCLQQGL